MSIYAHHRSDSPLWELLVNAANIEQSGDWPVVELSLAGGAHLLDSMDRIVDEVIYASETKPGTWLLEYGLGHPYQGWWEVTGELNAPANIITPGYLNGLFGELLEQGRTIRFQATVVDTYDCDDCRELPDEDFADRDCDHTLGWALIWAIQPQETTVQSF